MFSNIIKYADSDNPIRLSVTADEGALMLECSNMVRMSTARPESNGIGLKTCIKIMEEMGGSLSYREEKGFFTVSVSIPCEKK